MGFRKKILQEADKHGKEKESTKKQFIRKAIFVFILFSVFFTFGSGVEVATAEVGKEEVGKGRGKISSSHLEVVFRRDDIPQLRKLVVEALKHNPEIKAVREKQKSFRFRGLYSSSLPEPYLGVGAGLKTGMFPEAQISQRIPFPSKLSKRREFFDSHSDMWEWIVKATENKVVSELKKSFFDLWFLESKKKILVRMKGVLEDLLESAEIRYRVGQDILQTPIRVQVEISRIEEKIIIVNAEIEETRAKIYELVGKDIVLDIPEDISPLYIEEGAEKLREIALINSPFIKIAEKDVKVREVQLELAKLSYYPDFRIVFDTMGGMNRLLFAVDIPIYFWRDQRNRVKEAMQFFMSSSENLENEKLKVFSSIKALRELVNSTFRLAKLYEGSIIPQSESSFESARASWMVGKTNFITVLDSFLVLLMYEIEELNQKRANRKYMAELEKILVSMGDLHMSHLPKEMEKGGR